MSKNITEPELNYIIFKYLKKSGFEHAASNLAKEAGIDESTINGSRIPHSDLITLVEKGLQHMELEAKDKDQENDKGKEHKEEAGIDESTTDGSRIPHGDLITLVEKGLEHLEMETKDKDQENDKGKEHKGVIAAYSSWAMEKEKPSPTQSDDGHAESPTHSDDGHAEHLAEIAMLEHRILTLRGLYKQDLKPCDTCYWKDGTTTTYPANRWKKHFNAAHRHFDEKCRRCGGRFENKSSLQNHEYYVHSGWKPKLRTARYEEE